MRNQFGGNVTKILEQQYSISKHWDGKKFVNLEVTKMEFSLQTIPKLLYKHFYERNERIPKVHLPIIPFDKNAFLASSSKSKFIWYGHSALKMRVQNKTILIDPMFGSNASPIAPFATKRFSANTINIIDDFEEIDAVFLSHDHYDHIDVASLEKLIPKTKQFFVALGIARHLIKWGVDANKIIEFDWWQEHYFDDIKITYTPTRHFSGRGLTDKAKSLWGGWVFNTPTESIYFTGDGGYGQHFKEIGNRLGPFDIGFVECGQYNENWHQIHMYPEESVQAAIDAKIATTVPVHWAGFALALHKWKEPIERFTHEANQKNINFNTPKIGEIFEVISFASKNSWWENFS